MCFYNLKRELKRKEANSFKIEFKIVNQKETYRFISYSFNKNKINWKKLKMKRIRN